jgi:hypothetical protein
MKTHKTTGRTLNATQEDFVAQLTAAAYGVALQHRAANPWLDLELELWHALTDAASKWNREARQPAAV